MHISIAGITILNQLEELIANLSDDAFVKPSKVLSNSTIGQHLRHTLEFFNCLERGCTTGAVNYDKRAHDKQMETDRILALRTIERIKKFVSSIRADQSLHLEVGYNAGNEEPITVSTNYFRELIYTIEHAVHHMAIIKIGIMEVAPFIRLPTDFGVAASTIRYRKEESLISSD
jgi:uncharacterized damage-inducible protein DinB